MALIKRSVCRYGLHSIKFIHKTFPCPTPENRDSVNHSDIISTLLFEQDGGLEQTIEAEMGLSQFITGTGG